MVDRARLLFSSGIFLVFLSIGCAGTGSQHGSVASRNSQPSSLSASKRMVLIAQTYEKQGHNKRAINAYSQVVRRYSRSQQAKIARSRILALKEESGQKNSPENSPKTMLAKSTTKPVENDKSKSQSKDLSKETSKEFASLELPTPEKLADSAKTNSAKLLVSNDFEDAGFPAWSKDIVASTQAEASDSESPEISPSLSSLKQESPKEELLSPPAKPLESTPEDQQVVQVEENLIPERPSEMPSPEQDDHQEETAGWVTSSEDVEPVDKNQKQINQRLATLAYLIGNEETAEKEVLDSLKLLLDHEDLHVRINSAEALYRHRQGDEETMQTIMEALSSSDESDRFIALHVLVSAYEQSPEETIQIMVDQLEENSPSLQRHVALLLGDFRDHSSILTPHLQRLVDEHPDDEVKQAAQLSLYCLKE